MEKLQPSWPDLTFVESPLKKLITKQHNNMSCVTRRLVNYANSITLSVRDENNNLFDFNNMPLEFELEIN